MKKLIILAAFVFVFSFGFGVAQSSNTVCCEKTLSGAFCQDVPSDECDSGFRQVPTSCDSTSYCKAGTCYDSTEGICMDNTPQLVCNENGGVWSEESPPQCNLGCCILGDQAAYVSLVRCKRLSSFLGLETNYDSSILSELECIEVTQAQDKGACVFEFEFERTCKFTTRAECVGSSKSGGGNETVENSAQGEFFKDKLCSAEELGTICGQSTKTTCVDGKDEVYFVDTCGNPSNIYDASKIENQEYWTNAKDASQSCNPSGSNAESASCGNCNYLLGSFCRDKKIAGASPTYGDFICADLNCIESDGNQRLHGESWCDNDDGLVDDGTNSVGSRYFKRICINGEIVAETCDDFRNEICIEESVGDFSQAACRVNRWRDCASQEDQTDCENEDIRDCFWNEGLVLGNSTASGSCMPKYSPGLNFWNSEKTQDICSQANAQCIVEFEKKLFDLDKAEEGEFKDALDNDYKCKKNCHCLTEEWRLERASACVALGDCGPSVNWVGKKGLKEGFEVILRRV